MLGSALGNSIKHTALLPKTEKLWLLEISVYTRGSSIISIRGKQRYMAHSIDSMQRRLGTINLLWPLLLTSHDVLHGKHGRTVFVNWTPPKTKLKFLPLIDMIIITYLDSLFFLHIATHKVFTNWLLDLGLHSHSSAIGCCGWSSSLQLRAELELGLWSKYCFSLLHVHVVPRQ